MASQNLFDRQRLRINQNRVLIQSDACDFLLKHVTDEIVFRLETIMRSFQVAANIGAYHGMLSRALLDRFPTIAVLSMTSSDGLAWQCPKPALIADEETLPFANGSLDLAVSALSLHFVNDLPGTLIQIRRALKPDGLFIAALLGGDTLVELRQAFTIAESEITGGISPRVIPTVDIRDVGGLLQRAGFALPVSDSEKLDVTYSHPLDLMRELKNMRAGNILQSRSRSFARRDVLQRAIEIYIQRFSNDAGRIHATFEIIYMSGWMPHESQQKPLKRGSAAMRLADALSTTETTIDKTD